MRGLQEFITTKPDPKWGSEVSCEIPGCNQAFTRKADLHRHQLKHSTKPARWCCGDCCNEGLEKTFYRKDHLLQHLRALHDLPKRGKPQALESEPCRNQTRPVSLLFSTEMGLSQYKDQGHPGRGGYVDGTSDDISRLLTPENC
jgi:uncharacterized Zn-finger protein